MAALYVGTDMRARVYYIAEIPLQGSSEQLLITAGPFTDQDVAMDIRNDLRISEANYRYEVVETWMDVEVIHE